MQLWPIALGLSVLISLLPPTLAAPTSETETDTAITPHSPGHLFRRTLCSTTRCEKDIGICERMQPPCGPCGRPQPPEPGQGRNKNKRRFCTDGPPIPPGGGAAAQGQRAATNDGNDPYAYCSSSDASCSGDHKNDEGWDMWDSDASNPFAEDAAVKKAAPGSSGTKDKDKKVDVKAAPQPTCSKGKRCRHSYENVDCGSSSCMCMVLFSEAQIPGAHGTCHSFG